MKENRYAMLVFWSTEDNAWIVDFPELPGCMVHGSTITKAIKEAKEVRELYLSTMDSNKWDRPTRIIIDWDSAKKFKEEGYGRTIQKRRGPGRVS